MATDAVQTAETRGRPRIRDDDEILRAALQAFAEHGYEGMSLRTLNAEHGTQPRHHQPAVRFKRTALVRRRRS